MKRIEIKIIVDENQKEDLEMFISDCKAHGFNVTLEGGRHLPSWSGWYAVLKGENWCPLPDVEEKKTYKDNLPKISPEDFAKARDGIGLRFKL